MRSQTVLQELSANYGVYVSNGSACAKGKRSHVLTAMELSDEIIDKSIRISFSRYNTKEDIDRLIFALKDLIKNHPRS
jgi:cysteine desulfurase